MSHRTINLRGDNRCWHIESTSSLSFGSPPPSLQMIFCFFLNGGNSRAAEVEGTVVEVEAPWLIRMRFDDGSSMYMVGCTLRFGTNGSSSDGSSSDDTSDGLSDGVPVGTSDGVVPDGVPDGVSDSTSSSGSSSNGSSSNGSSSNCASSPDSPPSDSPSSSEFGGSCAFPLLH